MKFMQTAKRWLPWLCWAMMLPSCATTDSPSTSAASVNSSALKAPPKITLLPRVPYPCQEGTLTLDAPQEYYSKSRFLWALQTGKADN